MNQREGTYSKARRLTEKEVIAAKVALWKAKAHKRMAKKRR